MQNTYRIYLISDSTGETLNRIFLALKAQFKNFNYKSPLSSKNCEVFRLRMEKYRFLTPIPHTQIAVFPPKIKVWDLQKLRKQRDISVGILHNPTFHAVCAIQISTVRQ